MNARQRQIQRALAARRRQVARVLGEEAHGQCPGCGRVDRALGDHDCDVDMTVEEAKARILRQGGVIVRDAQHAPLAEIEGLMERVAGQFDSRTETVRVGTAAWSTLRQAICEQYDVTPSGERELSYKGIPVVLDDSLPPDTMAAMPGARSYNPVTYDEADKVEWDLKSFGDLGARATFTRRTRIATITGLSA
jgi:hypothetical protein